MRNDGRRPEQDFLRRLEGVGDQEDQRQQHRQTKRDQEGVDREVGQPDLQEAVGVADHIVERGV